MDQQKMALTARRMTESRAKLIRDNPFFGHLAMGLQLACAPCKTACTDGERLYFDPDFAETLKTEEEMNFIILHEVLHCALHHCTRGRSMDSFVFNVACDIVVNSMILEMWGLQTMFIASEEVLHLTPNGQEGRNYSAEEVYRMLLSAPPGWHMPRGSKLDRHDIWTGIEDKNRFQENWDRKINNAAKACSPGTGLTSSVRKLIEKLQRRSRLDWKQLLHDFLRHDTYDYTFVPPDRRFSDDFFLPAFHVDREQASAKDIWVCVDTSGSISNQQLSEALYEIQDAMGQVNLGGSISFFDSGITEPEPFDTEEEFKAIIPKGGGGTSYHVIFRYLREHLAEDPPKAILIFTDGYVHKWPEEAAAMDVPVLWLICKDGNTKAPWGQVAEI